MAESRLFKPIKVGNLELKHRIAMAPLTRLRASDTRIPTPMMKEYYSQRSAMPGTLIISEGTLVSPAAAGGFPGTPGIWSEEQVAAWQTITDEVHRKNCFIYCQLFAFGRAADAELAKSEGIIVVAPSAVPISEHASVPRAMTLEEIHRTTREFKTAAENAIKAGFDGVECHCANGYLVDQFLQHVSNFRDDEYGGSVENRSRFALDILKALVGALGSDRVGLRLSPWSDFQGMQMKDPIPQFSDLIVKARSLGLAYLHLVEARISGSTERAYNESLGFAIHLWNGPLLIAGGYDFKSAEELVVKQHPDRSIVVVFGRHYLANPDLVYRFKRGLELNAYNRKTFYTHHSPEGYVDYPFSEDYLANSSL